MRLIFCKCLPSHCSCCKCLQSNVPSATTFKSNVPPATIINHCIPTANTFHSTVPAANAFNQNVPPATAFNCNVPPATIINHCIPTANTFHPAVPATNAFNQNVPPASAFNHNVLSNCYQPQYSYCKCLPSCCSCCKCLQSKCSSCNCLWPQCSTSNHYQLLYSYCDCLLSHCSCNCHWKQYTATAITTLLPETQNNTNVRTHNNTLPTHRCARNWKLSSKSMEPYGIVDCTLQIWNLGKCHMNTFVSDDDLRSCAALHHPIQTQINKGVINEWPRDKNGRLLVSYGWLPDYITAVETFLVDPSHRCRVYGFQLFKLEKGLKQMKKTDCKCLIHNFRYAVKQSRMKDEETSAKSMKAALEHHFDDHTYCNPTWCQFRTDSVCKVDDSKWKNSEQKQTHNTTACISQ